MKLMITLEMKNYNIILTEKLPKYQLYHQAKIDKFKYVTGKDILPSNQQQIIEQAKFNYSSLGKAFEKQIKIIEDQGEKQVEFLKEQTKAIEGKPNNKNNQSRSSIVFDDLIEKRKNLLSELYESVGMNKLYFEYVGNTKDVSIY